MIFETAFVWIPFVFVGLLKLNKLVILKQFNELFLYFSLAKLTKKKEDYSKPFHVLALKLFVSSMLVFGLFLLILLNFNEIKIANKTVSLWVYLILFYFNLFFLSKIKKKWFSSMNIYKKGTNNSD